MAGKNRMAAANKKPIFLLLKISLEKRYMGMTDEVRRRVCNTIMYTG
jgi:hypothetical protein